MIRSGDVAGRRRNLVRAALLAGTALLALAAGVVTASAATSNVPAQASGKALADIEAQRQAIFQQILKNPSNIDLTPLSFEPFGRY